MIDFFLCHRFRYSGRTEYQSTHQNKARRTIQLERRPSQRYGRRQSHVLRERQKQQQQQAVVVATETADVAGGVGRESPGLVRQASVGCASSARCVIYLLIYKSI